MRDFGNLGDLGSIGKYWEFLGDGAAYAGGMVDGSLGKHGRVWESMRKYGRVWESLELVPFAVCFGLGWWCLTGLFLIPYINIGGFFPFFT